MDAIDKDGGPEITGAKDILGSGKTREVATTCSSMTVIQDLFGFIVGEEMMQYSIDTTRVCDISNEDIARNLLSDLTTIFVA